MQLTSTLVLAFSVRYFLLQDSTDLRLDTIGTVVLVALQSLVLLSDY
jgi:hypothetical protein